MTCRPTSSASKGVFTNTTQVDAYRGAGRPEAIYALERLMDYAARELGVDPLELRRKNFIKPAVPLHLRHRRALRRGRFPACSTAPSRGRRRGLRRPQGGGGGEGQAARPRALLLHRVDPRRSERDRDHRVHRGWRRDLYVGTQSNGQGHETVYRQFLHDQTGLPLDKIRDRAGRQRPDRHGRRHRRLALGHRQGMAMLGRGGERWIEASRRFWRRDGVEARRDIELRCRRRAFRAPART
jgi:CO/xanthine dehydrogenase Mo-binding subunit